jgi:hypothetical protein
MPLKQCREKSKPGFKWGDRGKCYTYTPGNKQGMLRARRKALKQGRAMHASSSPLGKILDYLISDLTAQIERIK